MDAIIFDIDGTLADVEHRRHHVTNGKKQWDAFFDEMVDDPPLSDVCMLAELVATHSAIRDQKMALFIFSGRPDSHRDVTEQWLEKHVPESRHNAEALLMRAAGDYRPDTEVKRDFLNAVRGQGYDVRFVVDDRPSVIQMWKDEGVTVLEHDSGEWDSVQRTWEPGELHLMVGPSGAGKSTYVNRHFFFQADNTLPRSALISSDALRIEIAGTLRDIRVNSQVFAAVHAQVKARIENGLNTIVDAPNLHARDRRDIRDLCPPETKIFYHVIDRPLADKHETAGWRDEVVINGEKLIDKHHQSFKGALKYVLRGDDDPRVTVYDRRKT